MSLTFTQSCFVPKFRFEIGINRGHIFSCVQPFYERAVSDQDRSLQRSLWVMVAYSLFIEGSHMTKNTASTGAFLLNI